MTAREMKRRVWGNEEGKDVSMLSEWSLRNGKTPHDVIRSHLAAISNTRFGGEGAEVAAREKGAFRRFSALVARKSMRDSRA